MGTTTPATPAEPKAAGATFTTTDGRLCEWVASDPAYLTINGERRVALDGVTGALLGLVNAPTLVTELEN